MEILYGKYKLDFRLICDFSTDFFDFQCDFSNFVKKIRDFSCDGPPQSSYTLVLLALKNSLTFKACHRLLSVPLDVTTYSILLEIYSNEDYFHIA